MKHPLSGNGTEHLESKTALPVDLDAPVALLALSVRAQGVLQNSNIYTLRQLVQWTPKDVLRRRNAGARTLSEIIFKLKSLGLELTSELERRRQQAVREKVEREELRAELKRQREEREKVAREKAQAQGDSFEIRVSGDVMTELYRMAEARRISPSHLVTIWIYDRLKL